MFYCALNCTYIYIRSTVSIPRIVDHKIAQSRESDLPSPLVSLFISIYTFLLFYRVVVQVRATCITPCRANVAVCAKTVRAVSRNHIINQPLLAP